MSWGERSCKHLFDDYICTPTMETCNVDCKHYESNGKKPDSVSGKCLTRNHIQKILKKLNIDMEIANKTLIDKLKPHRNKG